MGTLYRNGIPYVGSGGAGGVEVTQAEYDALPTSEKMNGSIYFITDGSVSYPTASQMRYDNTESGIPSTSVQGAIDELKIEIGDTDISSIGDGTVTGAVNALNNGLTVKTYEMTSTTNYYGNVDVPTNIVRPSTGAILSCSNDGNSKAFAPIGVKTSDKYILRFYNYATTASDVVANTSITVTIYYILYI